MHKSILIIGLILTFTFYSCETDNAPKETEVVSFIDSWHLEATNAKLEPYFDMMSEDVIYIGTDAGERWTKSEFYQFCEPYFSKGKAWDFKGYDRQIYFSKDGKTIWFDELLETWMGVCRGSGVIVNINEKLKISHYHLSVTIKNEKMKEFLQINQE